MDSMGQSAPGRAGVVVGRLAECLGAIQTLEVYWAYFSQSEGLLYAEQCRRAALQSATALEGAREFDRDFWEDLDEAVALTAPEQGLTGILGRLKEWSRGVAPMPWEGLAQSRYMVFTLCSVVREMIFPRLGARMAFEMEWTDREMEFTRSRLKWRSILPPGVLDTMAEDPAKVLSGTESVAVIGDVRRSQDLMTYSPSAEFFSAQMLKFLKRTRELLERHGGVFDKFTGDGFLAYFNRAVSEQLGKDWIGSFIEFAREELDFAKEHFQVWARHVRKLPPMPVGLTLGADVGRVEFRDEENVLFAVGDAIVWAERMCSNGGAGDLVANNLLAMRLESLPGLGMERMEGKTKASEGFIGYRVLFGTHGGGRAEGPR